MKAQTMKQIGTALIVIGLAGAYYTIATMNNRGGAIALIRYMSLDSGWSRKDSRLLPPG